MAGGHGREQQWKLFIGWADATSDYVLCPFRCLFPRWKYVVLRTLLLTVSHILSHLCIGT